VFITESESISMVKKYVKLEFESLFMRKRGSERRTKFVYIIKFEGLNPFYSLSTLLKVSRYISYRVYGIVIRIGSSKVVSSQPYLLTWINLSYTRIYTGIYLFILRIFLFEYWGLRSRMVRIYMYHEASQL
jgi:hypothetical protein